MTGPLSILALLLGLNVLFVLMEYALVKVRASRVEILARKGSRRALAVQDMLAHLDRYLAAIQVGITLVALGLGAFAEPGVSRWLKELFAGPLSALSPKAADAVAFFIALAILAFLQIVLGELIPRAIAMQKAEPIALWGAQPMQLFAALFRLPVWLMSSTSTAVLRLFGLKPASESESAISEEEMRVMLGETHEKGSFPLERLLLLENLFDIGTAHVAEAMIPREKIVYLSLAKTLEQNLEIVRSKRLSRYPLCERDDLDSAFGMIHVKDLLLKGEDGRLAADLKAIRREIADVSEHEPLEKLLKLFPDKGIHMALVRSKGGRVVGLLTLEDIVEELIGEVHDEFDLPQAWSLAELVVPSAVVVHTHAPIEKRAAMALLVGKLAAAYPALKEQDAINAVWERELKFSSAVGRGVAVPHGRLPGLERPLVAVGRFSPALPFPAPDGVAVRLLFLILTPAAQPMIQLKVLGRIASLVMNENLRRKLLRAKTAESMLDTLRTADTMLAA